LSGKQESSGLTLKEIEARMRPGNFSQAGFLGTEERLVDVLSADDHELRSLGVSPGTLAARLEEILAEALDSNGKLVTAHYKVRIRRYKGPQLCPFGAQPQESSCFADGDRRLASIDWNIVNRKNNTQLSGPGLIVHLIAAHGFFEGLQSPYRVSPRELIELLELRAASSN
jgi:hypothetical protein